MQRVGVGALVAKDGILPDLEAALATHIRIHSAEGFFYRDVFREDCQIPCRIIPPASLNITVVGKLTARPCGRDQKLAALAAWRVMTLARGNRSSRGTRVAALEEMLEHCGELQPLPEGKYRHLSGRYQAGGLLFGDVHA